MAKFPDSIAYSGFMTPSRFEAEARDLVVEGEVPAGMEGAFYRVQPDPQFPPKLGDDIAFNGDGQVTMFHFHDGQVDVKHRWVETDKFKTERKAGKALFGAYRNPLTDDPSVKGMYRGTANTNVIGHAGRLYALKEDSPAVVMDPVTLETLGYWDFDGRMTGETFTAHPKIDPETGQMIAFGYAAKGLLTRDIVYYEISPEGELTKETWFELPYYCMMHDFGVTRDYAVFHVVPQVSSWERLEKGLPHFGFDTKKDIFLGVLPRNGTASDIKWFTAPNLFASHVMNAWNDGTKVHFDIPVSKNNFFPFFPDIDGKPFNPMEALTFLNRWTVDMDSPGNEFESMTQLCPMIGEFPRIDDRFAMTDYRHGWMLVMDLEAPCELKGGRSNAGVLMNRLGHFDHRTGESKSWFCGPRSTLQEPCFVPRSAASPEGDGWLVMVENLVDDHLSNLLVFEATNVEQGPVATVKLPFRLKFGLHGNWTPADRLKPLA